MLASLAFFDGFACTRVIKYIVMGYCARYAPSALKFFGIDTKKLLADKGGKKSA